MKGWTNVNRYFDVSAERGIDTAQFSFIAVSQGVSSISFVHERLLNEQEQATLRLLNFDNNWADHYIYCTVHSTFSKLSEHLLSCLAKYNSLFDSRWCNRIC